jgi:hypothetical protein
MHWLALLTAIVVAPQLRAQPAPARQPAPQGARPATPAPAPKPPAAPQGDFEVYEWVVLLCDPNQPAANAERMFPSTLPEFVGARRAAAPPESASEPSPAGVIRVVAPAGATEGQKVDVLVQAPAGRFLATWPKGKGRTNRQLWEAYELRPESAALRELPAGHWFGALRQGPSVGLHRGRAGERFLLYDVELNYALPLRAAGGDKGSYELSNSGGAPLLDVTLFKPEGGAWRRGGVASMPAAKGVAPATGPSTAPTTGPATTTPSPAEVIQRMRQRRVAAGMPADTPLPTPPPPSTQPAAGASKAMVAADSPPAGATEALAPWKQRLTEAGLSPADVGQVLRILERFALDRKRMTVVYRLDPAELDRLLPLEVTPLPRKTVRVGIVVARNVDPAVGDEVDQLVKQLGADDWDAREAAYKQLAELGPAARPKLQAALNSKDLEVAWRAERLIQASEAQPAGPRRR